jgi:F0F1-type ATP synthase membrane subunit c/vacuolar-type H+-ATPase subunit K
MQTIDSRLNIIFIAFLFSSLVYLLVGFALTKSGWAPVLTSGNLDQILFAVFLALSIALIVLAFQIKAKLMPPARDDSTAKTVFAKSILLFALAEVPSILGLILFLLTGTFHYLVTLCVISIAAFVMVKPRS